MNSSPEQTVLRVIASQILEIYYKFQNSGSNYSQFYSEALPVRKKAGDTQLTVNPAIGTGSTMMRIEPTFSSYPFQLQEMYHIKKA